MCVLIGGQAYVLQHVAPSFLLRLRAGKGAGRTAVLTTPCITCPDMVRVGVCGIVIRIRISRGAVERVVAAVVARLPEHIVRNLQALVARTGRF